MEDFILWRPSNDACHLQAVLYRKDIQHSRVRFNIPWLDSNGRRANEWALLIMDPASAHRAEKVKDFCKRNAKHIRIAET